MKKKIRGRWGHTGDGAGDGGRWGQPPF